MSCQLYISGMGGVKVYKKLINSGVYACYVSVIILSSTLFSRLAILLMLALLTKVCHKYHRTYRHLQKEDAYV